MPLPGGLTLTELTGTYTAPDGTPVGGQLTFTPSSALTNESGHPVLAATSLTVRLQPGTGAFSIPLVNTDNAGLLPADWLWHVIVSVPGAHDEYFFGLPSTLGPSTDINALTPVSPPPEGVAFVASVNGQTGDVVLADGFGIVPPAGDLGGSTLAPHVTATHLSAPLPIAQGGTGAASGSAALAALGGIGAASPAFTGTPTAPTATALTGTAQLATTAYSDSAVAVEKARALAAEAALGSSSAITAETTRAEAAEGLAAQKSASLSDLASASTARANLAVPGLATANTMTADQYFRSGRPWFDAIAFGADPTNTANSTLAIQTAINTACGLRTDTGVSLSGTSVTDPAAVSGDVGKYVNHPAYQGGTAGTQGCSLITAVTSSPVGYTVATAATGTPTGQVVAIGSGSSIAGRTAAGPVFLPAGTYKVTSDLLIQSVLGFQLMGAGATSTILQVSGGGFTTAALNIDGSLDGCYGGFVIKGDGTEGTGGVASSGIPNALNLTFTTSAQRSTSGNTLYGIRVRNLKFLAGVSLAGVGARQLDGTVLRDIVVTGQQPKGGWTTAARTDTSAGSWSGTGNTITDTAAVAGDLLQPISGTGIPAGTTITAASGTTYTISGAGVTGTASGVTLTVGTGFWQYGFVFGNGTQGNIYDQVATGCGAAACYYGYYCNASSFSLFGAQPGVNAVDFWLEPTAQVTVENIQSQNSGQFILGPANASPVPVSFRDCKFAGFTHAGYANLPWISIGTSYGNWDLDNLTYSLPAGTASTPPTIDLGSANYHACFSLKNISQPNPPTSGIVPGSGGVAVMVQNYQDTTPGVGPNAVLYPFYAVGAGVLFQKDTAANRANYQGLGETFFWATDTSAFSHWNGSAWTSLAPGSVGGVTVTGTPSATQILAATSSTAATWVPASGGGAGAGIPTPASQGYVGWISDPLSTVAQTNPLTTTWLAGHAYYARCDVIPSVTPNGFISFVWVNPTGMTNCFFSVYTISGTTLTLVGSTIDLSSTATGWLRLAVSGFTSTPASGVLYVSYMNGTSGLAGGPKLIPGVWNANTPTSGNLPAGTAGQNRFMDFNGSFTSPPSSATVSSGSIRGSIPWFALD